MKLDDKANELFRQNLIDSGLSDKQIDKCIILITNDKISDLQGLIAEYRLALLKELHICQRKLDILDYFLYQIKKISKEKK